MSGLIGGITNATKALAAQQAGLEIAGRNLANVNTPGYARQRVVLGDRGTIETPLGNMGTGVEALGRIQIRDKFLDATVVREGSVGAALEAQEEALMRGEAALGERIQGAASETGSLSTGLSSTINDFFNGFESLAANPSDTAAKQVLFQKTSALADKFNSIDQRLSQLQDDLSTQVGEDTDAANKLLGQIADLNKQIGNAEISDGSQALELRDQRQARLEELGKIINFSTQPSATGTGQVDVIVKDANGVNVSLVQGGTLGQKLAFDGTKMTAGTPPTNLDVSGGSIAGRLSARDGAIQKLRDDLKATAQTIASAVNNAYNPGGSSTNLFASPAPTGSVLALDPSVTSSNLRAGSSGNAGANDVALSVAAVGRQKFSKAGGDPIDGTVSNFLAKTVSGYADTLNTVSNKVTDQQLVKQLATTQRDAVSGVSIDEEMTDLIKYQRAYEANARVVKAMDELLEGLINMVR